MDLFEELKTLGVNVDEGLQRMGGKKDFYKRLLGKFITSMNANAISPDFDTSDYTDAIEKAHTIKGVSGNMSITPLYEAYSEIVSLLRQERPEEAKKVLADVQPVQEKILQCIESHL